MPMMGARDYLSDLVGADMTPEINAERLRQEMPSPTIDPMMAGGGMPPDPMMQGGPPSPSLDGPMNAGPANTPNTPPPVSPNGAALVEARYADGAVWEPGPPPAGSQF